MSTKRKLLWICALIPLLLGIANLLWIRHTESRLQADIHALHQYLESHDMVPDPMADIPPGPENAARWAQAGTGLVEPFGTAIGTLDTQPATSLPSPIQDQLRAHLEKQRLPLSLVARGVDRQNASLGIFYELGFHAQIPDMMPFLSTGRLLLADAQLSAADGRIDDAVRAVDGLRTLLVSLANERWVITQLISYRIEALYSAGLKALVATGFDDIAVLERHARPIQPDHRRQFGRMIHFESTLVIDPETFRLFQPGLAGSFRFALLRGFRNVSVGKGIQHYRDLLKAAEGTASGLKKPTQLISPYDWPWLEAMSLAMPNVLMKSLAAEARAHAREIALALRLHALQAGRYPEDLSEIPSRRNPLNDRPFSYRLDEDGGAVLEIEAGPGALEEVFRELTGGQPDEEIAPFVWQLPPVAAWRGSA